MHSFGNFPFAVNPSFMDYNSLEYDNSFPNPNQGIKNTKEHKNNTLESHSHLELKNLNRKE